MAKISKRTLNKHNEALELLKKDNLTFDERYFVLKNYHEGANNMNNLISAHFTPFSIAHSMTFCLRNHAFVDLCAGIGMLSYAILRQYELGVKNGENIPFGICVENCTEYYNIGKKLLPEFHWINGDIFDLKVIDEIKSLMGKRKFSIVSNPPYGKQVKVDTNDLLKYKGSDFEYKAIELGALLGAEDGAFLIPQNSCPFRLSGKSQSVYSKEYLSKEYEKFVSSTDLEIIANQGFSTNVFDEDDNWKDVSITTEIAIVEYFELEYKPIKKDTPFINETPNQLTFF